jgi:hypothetical protein
MSKVYNCTLGAIREQLEDFGLEGQPVYQVALSRQSWDMGQAVFCDLNNTYKVFQKYFNDEIDVIDLTQYKKAFILPGCPVSQPRLKEALKEHNITVTNDVNKADFFVTHDDYGQFHTDGESIRTNSMLFRMTNYEAMDISTSENLADKGSEPNVDPNIRIVFDDKMAETYSRNSIDYDQDLYEAYVFTPLAIQIAYRIRHEQIPVIYAETCLNESANKTILDKQLLDDIIRMIRDGSEEEREMVKKIIPAIDYRKKKHLIWNLAKEVNGYMYRFNRDKDMNYWMDKSQFNLYGRNTAEDMIKQLEEEECLDVESFRYLEPIVRKEISINNRELYTFKVQVKEEYRKYLKIKK